MGSITLTQPSSGAVITAGLHATNYGAIQTLLNGNIDSVNILDNGVGVAELAHGTARQFLGMDSTDPAWISGGMHRISDAILSGTQASFDLQSIPQDFRSLRIILHGRGDTAAAQTNLLMRFNNDSGANYDYQFASAAAGTPGAGEAFGLTSTIVGAVAAATAAAGLSGMTVIDIGNYTGTTFNKVGLSVSSFKSGALTTNITTITIGSHWRSTAAISRVTLFPAAGNFAAGSSCTLYGIG